jgi:hypothetical protein
VRFHCSSPGEEKVTELHVSQEKIPSTSSFGAVDTVKLAELLVALFPAKVPNGSVWSTPVKVITPTTA